MHAQLSAASGAHCLCAAVHNISAHTRTGSYQLGSCELCDGVQTWVCSPCHPAIPAVPTMPAILLACRMVHAGRKTSGGVMLHTYPQHGHLFICIAVRRAVPPQKILLLLSLLQLKSLGETASKQRCTWFLPHFTAVPVCVQCPLEHSSAWPQQHPVLKMQIVERMMVPVTPGAEMQIVERMMAD